MKRIFIVLGAVSAMIAVLAGAFGSHLLKPMLSADSFSVFHTGVEYQFYHSVALIITGILSYFFKHIFIQRAGFLFCCGIVLFSFSLYALSTITLWGNDHMNWIGIFTPLGGLCFIIGWALIAMSVVLPPTITKK